MRAYPPHLDEALHPWFSDKTIEVMDWGCSGWTIVESMINYTIRGRLFKPDVVVLHHGINDLAPRLRKSYVFDYSHYRRTFHFEEFGLLEQVLNWSWAFALIQQRLGKSRYSLYDLTTTPLRHDDYIQELPICESSQTYRNALEIIGNTVKADQAKLVLAGMIYCVTQALPDKHAPIVEEHNSVSRSYAEKNGETYLHLQQYFRTRQDLFFDQAHLIHFGNQIKANLIANAIATSFGLTPHTWVTDDLNSIENLNGKTDYDSPNDRSLVIRWKRFPLPTRLIHVYIHIDGEKEIFLGKPNSLTEPYLEWKPGNRNVQSRFRSGPQYGHAYSFSIWGVGEQGEIIPPYIALEPVQYKQEL